MGTTTSLRTQLDDSDIIVCPGIHDALTARVGELVGFEALYMTGHGTSLAMTGYPDAGLVTMTEVIQNARNIEESVTVPVIADADTGYGNATNVIRTVREFAKTGVAAIQIEDQVMPKRCGHVAGRRIIPRDEATGKYRAAADTRDERCDSMLLIARTDARGAVGGDLDEAIDRANAYCDAGADIAFVEGPETEAEVEQIGEAVDAPLLYNCVGVSPKLEPDVLQRLGFDIVIYPIAATRAAILGTFDHFTAIKHRGTQAEIEMDDAFDQLPIDTDFRDPATRKFFEFGGFPEIYAWEDQYLPAEDRAKYETTSGEDISTQSDP